MEMLMSLITNNFWLLLLILLMVVRKPLRPCGIILLMTQIAFSHVSTWIIITVAIISVFAELDFNLCMIKRKHPERGVASTLTFCMIDKLLWVTPFY